MRIRQTVHLAGVGAALLLAASCAAWAPGTDSDGVRADREARRATEWKVKEIFKALGVQSGRNIADVGSGDGFLTVRLAPAVGPAGRIFAVDIDDGALRELKKRLKETGTTNVEVVRGGESDPHLAPASLDGVVILRAYHEFSHYREMLAAIRAALRPGGRLVVLDVEPASSDDRDRDRQFARHVLSHAIVEGELTEAGFHVTTSLPSFASLNGGETAWLIAAERPLPSQAESAQAPHCDREAPRSRKM